MVPTRQVLPAFVNLPEAVQALEDVPPRAQYEVREEVGNVLNVIMDDPEETAQDLPQTLVKGCPSSGFEE